MAIDSAIRKYREDDKEQCRALWKGLTCPRLRSEEGFVVAEIDGEIVGFSVVTSHQTPPWWDREVKMWCEIVELHVYHKLWRRGVGTQLVHRALDCAKPRGAEAVYVITGESNITARRLREVQVQKVRT